MKLLFILLFLTSCAGINRCKNFRLTVTEKEKKVLKQALVFNFAACEVN